MKLNNKLKTRGASALALIGVAKMHSQEIPKNIQTPTQTNQKTQTPSHTDQQNTYKVTAEDLEQLSPKAQGILSIIDNIKDWPDSTTASKEEYYQLCKDFFLTEIEYLKNPNNEILQTMQSLAVKIDDEGREQEGTTIEEISNGIVLKINDYKNDKRYEEFNRQNAELDNKNAELDNKNAELDNKNSELDNKNERNKRGEKLNNWAIDIRLQKKNHEDLIKTGYEILSEGKKKGRLGDGGTDDELFQIYAEKIGLETK